MVNSRSNGPITAGLYRGQAPPNQVNQPASTVNRSEIVSLDEKITAVQRRCRSFFSTAVKQMQLQFNFDDEVYDVAEFLNPVNAISCKPLSLAPIFLRFSFLRDS